MQKTVSNEKGKLPIKVKMQPFWEHFKINFQSFNECFFCGTIMLKIIIKQQTIIQYKNLCVLCIFDCQIADFSVQKEAACCYQNQ